MQCHNFPYTPSYGIFLLVLLTDTRKPKENQRILITEMLEQVNLWHSHEHCWNNPLTISASHSQLSGL